MAILEDFDPRDPGWPAPLASELPRKPRGTARAAVPRARAPGRLRASGRWALPAHAIGARLRAGTLPHEALFLGVVPSGDSPAAKGSENRP